MPRIVVELDEKTRTTVVTVNELDQALDAIDREGRAQHTPLAVRLISVEGHGTLDIVVGAERSWLHHEPADHLPPYSVSRGDETNERIFEFWAPAHGLLMEEAWRETVSLEAAREAARHFLRTGKLDERIRWSEV